MKGLSFVGDRRLAFLEVDDPAPGVGDVIVEIKASGMCGSDLHPYRAAHDPDVPLERRRIGGHEPCGVVVAVGDGVPPHVARTGDRVMVHHYYGCSICEHCRTGWPQLCSPTYRRVHSVHDHGAHAPFMRVPATTLVKLHDELSYEAGAAIACGTGTAWGALERLQPNGGDTIAVFGQGPVGLSATLLATARGHRVIAVDVDEQRLALARSFGADATVNPRTGDAAAAMRELTGGKGLPASIETSGTSDAAATAMASAAIWGKVCVVGLGGVAQLETWKFLDRQLTLMTSYSMSIVGQKDCADFVVSRGLDLDRLFTDRWRLDEAEAAYEKFDRQSSGKGVFVF